MKFFYFFSILFFGFISNLFAQDRSLKTERIVLITLDGMRWQEVFTGADSLLVDDSGWVKNPGSLLEDFWDSDFTKRREKLMPFVWGTLAKEGQLYGNRKYGNNGSTSNSLWFSYPGYNELLSGYADDLRITSNDKVNNPNVTFLEYLQRNPLYEGQVKAVGGWDVFPYILHENRSGISVNAGFDIAEGEGLTEVEKTVNRLQQELRGPWENVRLDPFTHAYALETLKKHHPKVAYFAYGETDDWAHQGAYDQYLWSARQSDAYIQEIWEYLQEDPFYKGKTTLLVTVDHGRGTGKENWKNHGASVEGSGQVWLMVMGPDTPALGEIKDEGQWYTSMLARSIFHLLGLDYPDPKAAPRLKSISTH